MKLYLEVSSFYDRKIRHKSQLQEGAVAVPSHLGEDLFEVLERVDEPNYVDISFSEDELDRLHADHVEGVKNIRQGYTAIHEGGERHGQEVVIAPRMMSEQSKADLLVEHLTKAVLPAHCDLGSIQRVRILDSRYDPEETKALEKFLNRRLASTEDVLKLEQPRSGE